MAYSLATCHYLDALGALLEVYFGLIGVLFWYFQADVVLVMTCAIRDSAEQKIWNKLQNLCMLKNRRACRTGKHMKIGILGICYFHC